MPRAPRVQTMNWVFTINNPKEDEDPRQWADVKYLIFQKEKGEEGTEHFQGYVIFDKQKTLLQVKALNSRAHWEKRSGTHQQAKAYCQKEESRIEGPWEKGTEPVSKERQGQLGAEAYKEAWDLAVQGKILEIPEGLRIKYYRTFLAIRKDYMPEPQTLDCTLTDTNLYVYGPPRIGKSEFARKLAEKMGVRFYTKNPNKWWDGYQEEQMVVIDDLDPVHSVLGHHIKIWTDRYSINAETKGGAMLIRPHMIIITSNYSLDQIFEEKTLLLALKSRMKVVHCESKEDLQKKLGCYLE